MERGEGFIWSRIVPGLNERHAYGYRVSGPWDPFDGTFCNNNKVLLDPYARAIAREPQWHHSLVGISAGICSVDDSGEYAALAAVLEAQPFDWQGAQAPKIPWNKTIIYEAHVKGLTQLCPKVPNALRGTYLGVCSEPMLEHYRKLGVTSIEVLPVHAHFDEFHLASRGKKNYWGYNPLSYFAPSPRYAVGTNPGDAIVEWKTMVRTLHKAGIELILDVVFNHTCEGNELGPTLSFRGFDNAHYYRLDERQRSKYEDFTGCGNTFDVRNPMTLKLVLDSLRYWVQEMHVDGFRFDLTSALIHAEERVDLRSSFLTAIQQDPTLSKVKLIAEPWDCSFGGYMVGKFPYPWHDWNGQFRDSVRSFWRGDQNKVGALASRLSGSSDFFSASGRSALASINFVTAHDGFTLRDALSYSEKQNWDNGEENRDGENNNFSFNCGAEGETSDPDVLALRALQRRNLIATLLCAKGVPMILAGDELGRTQKGNNNAYCQDNELSWLDWSEEPEDDAFFTFVSSLISIRLSEPLLHSDEFYSGELMRESGVKDVSWFTEHGVEFQAADWSDMNRHSLGMWIVDPKDSRSSLLLLFNSGEKGVDFTISTTHQWEILLDTSSAVAKSRAPYEQYSASYYPLPARSMVLLKQVVK